MAATSLLPLLGANLTEKSRVPYPEFKADAVRASHRFITTVQSRDYALDEGATINHAVPRDTLLLT